MQCLGCSLANKHEPVYVVLEDEYICCFLDHNPFNEGHTLILPKKHYYDVEELDDATARSVMKASMMLSKVIKKLYNPDGITVSQNGGIFNELSHYHMHVVPRYINQSFAAFYSEYDTGHTEKAEKLKETQAKLVEAIDRVNEGRVRYGNIDGAV
ncbi:HIT family protein [Paenibacillus sp. strain BS8-2]